MSMRTKNFPSPSCVIGSELNISECVTIFILLYLVSILFGNNFRAFQKLFGFVFSTNRIGDNEGKTHNSYKLWAYLDALFSKIYMLLSVRTGTKLLKSESTHSNLNGSPKMKRIHWKLNVLLQFEYRCTFAQNRSHSSQTENLWSAYSYIRAHGWL